MPTSDIVRLDAAPGGVSLFTRDGSFDLDATLTQIQERLNPKDFVRVHRSRIVNLSHVTNIRRYDDRRYTIQMNDGSSLLTSRQGATELRDLME